MPFILSTLFTLIIFFAALYFIKSFFYAVGFLLIGMDIVLVGLMVVVLGLLFAKKYKWAKRLMIGTVTVFILISVIPLPTWGVTCLENYYQKPDLKDEKFDGFIFLGGSLDLPVSNGRKEISGNQTAARYFNFMKLVKKFPNKKVVFSGGGYLKDTFANESVMTKKIFEDAGISTSHFIFEDQSQNTIENAVLSYHLIKPKHNERWVLVTSAYHLPRSVLLFRGVGWNVIPYPVDYHTTGKYIWFKLPRFEKDFLAYKAFMKEILGMAYGYIHDVI
jgi:uncharacterized SAM-binding protein YcdF (DUF218 family)